MANYAIKIEAVKINSICPRVKKEQETYVLNCNSGAEVPNGMCARAFHTIYPVAMAMRFSDEISWEKGRGYFDVVCPDGNITYRLSRIKNNVCP